MRKKWWVAVASASVLGFATAAVAANVAGPRVDLIQAAITYRHATVDFRSCQGQQGGFTEARVKVTGSSTGQAALTGDVTLELRNLVNDDSGDGFQRGTFVVRDPGTGKIKTEAGVADAGTAEIFQGTLVGTVKDGGRTLVANWRTTFHDNGAVTGQIGGQAADGRMPAVVASGNCTGAFTRVEEDFPPPTASDAVSPAVSGGGVAWLRTR